MTQITQIVLVVFTMTIVWRLLRSGGQRTQAIRRLGFLILGVLAVLSILFPTLWTRMANAVGVGRGTDLILYGLVVAFFGFVVTSFRRNRDLEIKYTRLARRIALDEAAIEEYRRDTGPEQGPRSTSSRRTAGPAGGRSPTQSDGP